MFSIFGSSMDESKLDRSDVVINTNLPVYITMSTIPSRLQNTLRIIKNFMQHVSGFEKLILNVPDKYNRWPNYKTNNIEHDIQDGRFVLNRCRDHGPLTKLLPVIPMIPDNAILIVCDDMCYKLQAFADIAHVQDRRLSESFSFFVYPYGSETKVDVPQGADLISMYAANVKDFVKWFDNLRQRLGLRDYFESPCFFVDDQVIGWYFQYMNIPMRQVERNHRNIYIRDCDKANPKDNLNNQSGDRARGVTMSKCYNVLSNIYPIKSTN